jgi:hypothetical protein
MIFKMPPWVVDPFPGGPPALQPSTEAAAIGTYAAGSGFACSGDPVRLNGQENGPVE